MMKLLKIQRVLLIIGAVVLSFSGLVEAQDPLQMRRWNVNQRLQISYEQDDNVLEALHQPVSSPSLKLSYDAKGRTKLRSLTLQMGYHGGYQFYWQVENENKLINEIHIDMTFAVRKQLLIGWQGWGRLKFFLSRQNDYAYGGWRLFAQTTAPGELICKIGYGEELLDYAQTDFYSFYSPGLFFQLHRRLNRHFALLPQLHFSSARYKRLAFDKGDNNYSFWLAPYRQRDKVLTLTCNLEGCWPSTFFTFSYRYEMNASNSYGYSYHRHIVALSFIKRAGEFYFRGYGTLQKKSYHDNLLPFYPLQLDTEREESNFLVLDVTRDFCSFMGLVLRAAWYKNESPWASLYYEKRLLSVGAEFKF